MEKAKNILVILLAIGVGIGFGVFIYYDRDKPYSGDLSISISHPQGGFKVMKEQQVVGKGKGAGKHKVRAVEGDHLVIIFDNIAGYVAPPKKEVAVDFTFSPERVQPLEGRYVPIQKPIAFPPEEIGLTNKVLNIMTNIKSAKYMVWQENKIVGLGEGISSNVNLKPGQYLIRFNKIKKFKKPKPIRLVIMDNLDKSIQLKVVYRKAP